MPGNKLSAMKPPVRAAPTRLTPSEIASLRACKQELHRRAREIRARKAVKAVE
jgi:hypothetical protein